MKYIYNEKLFDCFDENEIKSGLESKCYINLINCRNNRFKSDVKSVDLAYLDSIENYIYKSILENSTNKYTLSLINDYKKYLYDYFLKNPIVVFDSILFNDEIIDKLFSFNEALNIKKFKYINKENFLKELNLLRNNSNQELKRGIISYSNSIINSKDENDNKFTQLIFQYLLNNIKYNDNLYSKEFMLKYASHMIEKDLNIKICNVYVSDYDFDPENTLLDKTYATYTPESRVIVVNKKYLNDKENNETFGIPNYIYCMKIIAHEQKHNSQTNDIQSNNITYENFAYVRKNLIYKYYNDINKNNNEYHLNYANQETELNAEYYAWSFVLNLMNKYLDNDKIKQNVINNGISIIYRKQNSLKYDISTGNLKDDFIYNIDNLNKIVSDNKNIINDYPVLRYFYNNNGSVKNIKELLLTKNYLFINNKNIFKELKYVFDEYVLYELFNNFEMSKIKTYSDNLKMSLYAEILILIYSELKSIEQTIEYYNIFNDKKFNGLPSNNIVQSKLRLRCHYSSELIDYFLSNYKTILDFLNNSNVKNKNEILDNYINILERIEYKLEKYKSIFTNNDTYNSLLKLCSKSNSLKEINNYQKLKFNY